MKVAGRSAMVTGGASGLGLATVRRLTSAGARVIAIDLPDVDRAALSELGDSVVFIGADVTEETGIAHAVDRANERRDLSVVVNCAGVGTAHRTLSREGPFPLAAFAKVISINLVGTFNVLRLSAAAMSSNDEVAGERGVIVNTASVAAFDGQVGQAAYAASKSGVVGMTLPVARDLASSKIRVMTIAPGLFETPMLAALPAEAKASLGQQVPHPSRLGAPDEYAALVQAIVENPMLNGETIRLDGAIRMAPR